MSLQLVIQRKLKLNTFDQHLIRDFQMTNQVTDHGLLESSMGEVKKAELEKIVETVCRKVADEKREKSSVYGSQEEMLEKAKTGYFVRDPERNLVYCPAGEILRQKCIKKNGITKKRRL